MHHTMFVISSSLNLLLVCHDNGIFHYTTVFLITGGVLPLK